MRADRSFQLKSMTAFGRGVSDFSFGRFVVEIQSVNRRYLEINISLPRLFLRFEMELRKQIAACIGRGALTVSVIWKADSLQPIAVRPNLALAKALKGAWEEIAQGLGIEKSVPVQLLMQEKDLFLYEEEVGDEVVYRKALMEATQEALEAMLLMKEQEGERLKKDLQGRCAQLRHAIDSIEQQAKDAPEKYRQKLSKRLQELFAGSAENEERILREVAIYADRVDITEEIIRFKSHLVQFIETLERPLVAAEARGKTLDFLLQECLREANTIGSKTPDLLTIQHVVTIKSELEKIREQVQNIE